MWFSPLDGRSQCVKHGSGPLCIQLEASHLWWQRCIRRGWGDGGADATAANNRLITGNRIILPWDVQQCRKVSSYYCKCYYCLCVCMYKAKWMMSLSLQCVTAGWIIHTSISFRSLSWFSPSAIITNWRANTHYYSVNQALAGVFHPASHCSRR